MDGQRGIIPYFNLPPDYVYKENETAEEKRKTEEEINDLQKQLKEPAIVALEDMDKEEHIIDDEEAVEAEENSQEAE